MPRKTYPEKRYEIRAWAPSSRARKRAGEVRVRTYHYFTNDPHYAAIELYRMQHEGPTGWRFEVLDHGPSHRYELGEVVGYDELLRRARSSTASQRDPRRTRPRAHHHRSPGAPTFAKQRWISRKIRTLRHEGYPPKQAQAIAYSMAGVARRRGRNR